MRILKFRTKTTKRLRIRHVGIRHTGQGSEQGTGKAEEGRMAIADD